MDFLKTVRQRRSIRSYLPKQVPQKAIDEIMSTAVLAPSWKNGQCCRFIIIKNAETQEKIAKLIWHNRCSSGILEAPVLIVMCALPDASACNDGKEYYLVDAGIAMEHAVLAAASKGLGTCWVGLFDEKDIKELLNIPEKVRVVAMSPLGYPSKEELAPRSRMAEDKVIFNEEWQNR